MDDGDDGDGKEDVGGERRQKLGERLNLLGELRPQADPHANRHPKKSGQDDQHDHAQ